MVIHPLKVREEAKQRLPSTFDSTPGDEAMQAGELWVAFWWRAGIAA
jgi:hypothetical protein